MHDKNSNQLFASNCLFFLTSIKFLIKVIIANNVVNIIILTRITAAISPRPRAPNNGFIRPKRITNVKRTAIWATTLFSLINPGVQTSKIIPQ